MTELPIIGGDRPYEIFTTFRSMGLFSNLLKKKISSQHDNGQLLTLLASYWKDNGSEEKYQAVALELMNGHCFLLLPTKDPVQTAQAGWHTTKSNTKIGLASIYTIKGKKVLAAFADEQALLRWSTKPCPYVSLRGKVVLQLCEANNFSRLVINSHSDNVFVLEQSPPATIPYTVKKGTTLQIGAAEHPLGSSTIRQLISFFQTVAEIEEVYQYGQTVNQQFSLVLGFKLDKKTINLEDTIISAVQQTIQEEDLQHPLDIFFIESDDEYDLIKGIEGAVVYKKI